MKKRHDWFMVLLVVPIALLGAFVLYFGAKDVEEKKMYDVDSLRQIQKTLRGDSVADSIHFYEDGF